MSRLFIRLSITQITVLEPRVSLRNLAMASRRLQLSRPPRIRLILLSTLPMILAAGAGSCSPAVLGTATLWSANVNASTPGGIQATLGVVSQFGQTRASLSMRFGEPDSTYDWRMAQGDCASEGKLVGGRAAYPDLAADSTGAASANAVVSGTLTAGGSYAARILQTSGGTEQVVACGVMQQTN
jgi:hypothetical protein